MFKTYIMRFTIITIAGVLGACSSNQPLNSQLFPEVTSSENLIDGNGIIYMTTEEVEFIHSHDTDIMNGGSWFKVETPIGAILQSAAQREFDTLLSGGAQNSSERIDADFTIVPILRSASYNLNTMTNLGFTVIPKVNLSASIVIMDREDNVIMNERFDVYDHSAEPMIAEGNPGPVVGAAMHEAAAKIMSDATSAFTSIMNENKSK